VPVAAGEERPRAIFRGRSLAHDTWEDDRMNDQRPLFQHPPWMVGIMLILGVMSLLVGLTIDPFRLVMGSPAILTLIVYIGVRVALSLRMRRQPLEHDEWVSHDTDVATGPGSTHDSDNSAS
jgi:hypothetical protein